MKTFTSRWVWFALITSTLTLSGCASAGKDFKFRGPESIQIGKTTKSEIAKEYGEPFRVGYDSGDLQWTYGYYHFSAFSEAKTKDLVIVFDSHGKVKNYQYNSSLDEDREHLYQERKTASP